MNLIIELTTLFLIGSIAGWILELGFKRINAKKWINPGFLSGPYLPIYGFGLIALYLINLLSIHPAFKMLIAIFGMSFIEYIGGLFFLKYFKIRLWDYSNLRGNIQGLVCPLFSAIWGLLALGYMHFLATPAENLLTFINNYENYALIVFVIGISSGIVLVDMINNLNVATLLRRASNKLKTTVVYEKFKLFIGQEREKRRNFVLNIKISDNIHKNITKFNESLKKIVYIDNENIDKE